MKLTYNFEVIFVVGNFLLAIIFLINLYLAWLEVIEELELAELPDNDFLLAEFFVLSEFSDTVEIFNYFSLIISQRLKKLFILLDILTLELFN